MQGAFLYLILGIDLYMAQRGRSSSHV